MRHILWAVAWMGLGLLITLAAANVLQGVATSHEASPAPAIDAPARVNPPVNPRARPAEPGRSLQVVSRQSTSAE